MGNDLITHNDEEAASFFSRIASISKKLEKILKAYRPVLNGDRYLTDKEISQRLKVSRRTLQEYRKEGKIPYYQLGGKTLYKESDIQKLLDSSYHKIHTE